MNSVTQDHPFRSLFAALALLGAGLPARAIDAGNIAVHGAVSTTASYSERYSYNGALAGATRLNITEITLNGSHRFEGGTRASAQLYSYNIGDYRAIALDFASVDYSFNQHFGVRAGRVKHAFGLYGDSQDLDMIRPFVFLPLDFYSKGLRPINASFDGAALYGNVPLGKGSFEYQVFGGWVPDIDPKSPFFTGVSEAAPFFSEKINRLPIYGTWLMWNTPIDGLRIGASATFVPTVQFDGNMRSASSLVQATSDARMLPNFFPPGVWDAVVAGKPAQVKSDVALLYLSAEYTFGNWQVAAEATYTNNAQTTTLPVLGTSQGHSDSGSYYGMVTWQAAPKLQFGAYYGIAHAKRDDPDGSKIVSLPAHTGWLKDLTFAASYSLSRSWLVKAEVHDLNGTKGLRASGNIDAARWQPNWTYFAFRTTFSF